MTRAKTVLWPKREEGEAVTAGGDRRDKGGVARAPPQTTFHPLSFPLYPIPPLIFSRVRRLCSNSSVQPSLPLPPRDPPFRHFQHLLSSSARSLPPFVGFLLTLQQTLFLAYILSPPLPGPIFHHLFPPPSYNSPD